jgi:hypothetical protein
MKSKNLLLAILALSLVFAMMAVSCNNDQTDNNNGPLPIKFVSTDSSGSTYTLVITPGTANSVAKDDSYVLTISKSGQPDKVSKGTITNVASDGKLTMQPGNSGSTTFEVTINNDKLTAINGTITVGEGEGTTVNAPGTVTPGSNNNNGGGEVTNGTFTITGIPAEYNGKYAGLTGTPVPNTNSIMLYGFQSFNAGIATLSQISNGSVKIPMWYVTESNQNPAKYTGSNTCTFTVVLVNSQTVNFPVGSEVQLIASASFESVPFTNGGATRAWNGGGSGNGNGNGNGGGDNMKWTAVTDSTFGSTGIMSIAYVNGKFVAGGRSGKMATSTDGVNWTAVIDSKLDAGPNNWILGITYANGKFVATSSNIIAYSSDGETWTRVTVTWEKNPFYNINAIAYGNGKFVAVGDDLVDGVIAYSSDGVTWSEIAYTKFPFQYFYPRFFRIFYANDKFFVTCLKKDSINSNIFLMTSPDGLSWTAATNSSEEYVQSYFAYGNNKFVAGGGGGKMATSPDGETWTAVDTGTLFDYVYDGTTYKASIKGITYGNNKFVAGGYSGKMATSTDGSTWTAVTNSTFGTSTINGIAYGNGKFVAVGDSGKMAYSLDN